MQTNKLNVFWPSGNGVMNPGLRWVEIKMHFLLSKKYDTDNPLETYMSNFGNNLIEFGA